MKLKPKKLTLAIGLLLIILIAISIIFMKNNQGSNYSNEFYSIEYPSDWEHVKIGLQIPDLPETARKTLGLHYKITNLLVSITLRPKDHSIPKFVSILAVASSAKSVLEEIRNFELDTGGFELFSPGDPQLPFSRLHEDWDIRVIRFSNKSALPPKTYYVINKSGSDNSIIIYSSDGTDPEIHEIFTAIKFNDKYTQ